MTRIWDILRIWDIPIIINDFCLANESLFLKNCSADFDQTLPVAGMGMKWGCYAIVVSRYPLDWQKMAKNSIVISKCAFMCHLCVYVSHVRLCVTLCVYVSQCAFMCHVCIYVSQFHSSNHNWICLLKDWCQNVWPPSDSFRRVLVNLGL